MGWWSAGRRKQANTWTYAEIPPERTPEGAGSLPRVTVASDAAYVEVILHSFRVCDVRKGLSQFWGTLHSFIDVAHASAQRAGFHVVATPGELRNVNAENVDRVICMGKRLLGPVPYRGDDLEMELGLFSVKSTDLAAPYLHLLQHLSDQAGVSDLRLALPFAGPIREGIDLLTGADQDTILEIGLSKAFHPLKTGYYAVMRANAGVVDPSKFRVDGAHRLVDDSSGMPIGHSPYLLFSIRAMPRRDLWFELPDIKSAYEVLKHAVESDRGGANDAFTFFRITTLLSPDLLFDHAQTLVDKVHREISAVLGTGPVLTRSSTNLQLPELKDIDIFEPLPPAA